MPKVGHYRFKVAAEEVEEAAPLLSGRDMALMGVGGIGAGALTFPALRQAYSELPDPPLSGVSPTRYNLARNALLKRLAITGGATLAGAAGGLAVNRLPDLYARMRGLPTDE